MINLSLTPTDAALVLAALRHSAQDINAPQIDALIDTVQNEINLAEREADAEERDLFRTDAEADADAHASAGYGTDEDYRPAQPAEDAHLDSYWEERNEGGHYYYNIWEDDGV